MNRGFGAACAALALAAAPMPATAACWNADETSAATVRELQSVLMVAALRCQAAGKGFMDDYNGFLRANRYTIQQMNDRIKAHFIKAVGPARGLNEYDAFATALANGHGAEGASVEICSGMAALAREAALMAGSAEGLLLLSARQGLVVTVPEGPCTRAPVLALEASPAAVMTAAAAPASAPVTAMADAAPPVAIFAAEMIASEPSPATQEAPRSYYAAPDVYAAGYGAGAHDYPSAPLGYLPAPR